MRNFNKLRIAYIFVLHILLALVLLKSDFIEKLGYKIGVYSPKELSSYYDRITNYHLRMDESIPEGASIFIGDSITQSLATSAIANSSVNYGIGSDTTIGVLSRIPRYKSLDRANSVVIAIGINDLKRRNNKEIVDNYKDILESIPENVLVVVSAILPVDERIQGVNSENKRIIRVNKLISELVKKYENVMFSDAGRGLRGSDNNLKSEFHVGDGVHLSFDGYQIWIEELKRALNNE